MFGSSWHLLSSRATFSWMELNFLTKIYVCNQSLVFSNSQHFLVFLKAIPDLCLTQDFFRVLVILFSCYLSIRLSLIFLLFPYFTKRLFCFFFILLLVCSCAFLTYVQVEFSIVILEFRVLFVLLKSFSVSIDALFFRQYLLIYLFKLCFSYLSAI